MTLIKDTTEQEKLLPGDVLIQTGGQPWVFAAWLLTGHGNPHAAMVDSVDADGTLWVIEDTVDGVRRNPWDKPGWIGRRPNCPEPIRLASLASYKERVGKEPYGYGHLLEIALGTRLGLFAGAKEDADEGMDWKICSESISFHQVKSGFDPCPKVVTRYTLPYDLLVTDQMITVAQWPSPQPAV